MAAGEALALLERLEDQRFLLRAHALAARGCGRRRRPARDRRACGCRARDRASPRSSDRRPAGAAGRASSAETRRAARGGYSASPVSAISRMRAARSLPMPGISRSPVSSSRDSSCGWLATMSAPLRYARILNGFSFLISSRSAISRRMRAIAGLSKPQAFGLDPVVEHAGAAGGERRGDRGARARAARSRTGSRRRRRRRPWPPSRRRPCARAIRSSIAGVVTPGASRLRLSHSIGDLPADLVPVAVLERRAHRRPRCRGSARSSRRCARSPSSCRLVISQLLVPELRGAPV